MKTLLSTRTSDNAFGLGMLLIRLGAGALMIAHGYDKLKNFSAYSGKFMSFLGLGQEVSLALVVFAEFFCAALIVLGLFTRLATIPLIITMAVALVKAHNSAIFGEGEMAALYLTTYLGILFLGAGKFSVDRLIAR